MLLPADHPLNPLKAKYAEDGSELAFWEKNNIASSFMRDPNNVDRKKILDIMLADRTKLADSPLEMAGEKLKLLRDTDFQAEVDQSVLWTEATKDTQWYADLIDTLDSAWVETGGWINPLELAQYDVETLRFLNVDENYGVDLNWLYRYQNGYQAAVEAKAAYESLVDEQVRLFESERTLQNTLRHVPVFGPLLGVSNVAGYNLSESDALDRTRAKKKVDDALAAQAAAEAQLAEWRAENQRRLAAGKVALPNPNPQSDLEYFFTGGMELVGSAMSALATGVGGVLWLYDKAMPGSNVDLVDIPGIRDLDDFLISPWDYMASRREIEVDELLKAADTTATKDLDEYINKVRSYTADQQWQMLGQEAPELREQYMWMAGGDELMAQGFFWADTSERLNAETQLLNAAKQQRAQEKQFIDDLAEADFSFSTEVMDLLSMYGRNVPGRLGTAFTLLLTDSDIQDPLLQGKWAEAWNETGKKVEQHDFTPSSVVGIEGSLLGLTFDLGMGIAFDPTTYFWGPKFGGSLGGVAAKSMNEAKALVASPMMRQMTRDIINLSTAGRGPAAIQHLVGWLDGVAQAAIFQELGYISADILPRPWKKSPKAAKAQEISTNSLLDLLSEADIADSLGLSLTDDAARTVKSVDDSIREIGMADDIAKNGFTEPIEITISRADNSIHVTDGRKRILAAKQANIKSIPARVRVVDDASKGTISIPHYTNDEAALIREIAEASTDDLMARALEANPDIEFKPGGDLKARDDFMNDPKVIATLDDTSKTTPIGQLETRRGPMQVFRSELPENEVMYAIRGADGEVHSVVYAGQGTQIPGDFIIATDRVAGAQMENLWKMAEQYGDKFVVQAASAPTISASKQGLNFVQRYARNRLAEATGVLRTEGRPIAEVFPDGINKNLKGIESGAGEVIVRPDSLLPFEFVSGGISESTIHNIVQASVLRGARPSDAGRGLILRGMNGSIRAAVRKGTPESWRRWFTQMNTTTEISLPGRGSIKIITEQTMKIWGSDTAKANEWISRFQEAVADANRSIGKYEDDLAPLRDLSAEVQALTDATGGMLDDVSEVYQTWDDLIARAEDAVKAAEADSAVQITVNGKKYTPEELDAEIAREQAIMDQDPNLQEKPTPTTDAEAQARGLGSLDEFNSYLRDHATGRIQAEEFSRLTGYTDEAVAAMQRRHVLSVAREKYLDEIGAHGDPTDPFSPANEIASTKAQQEDYQRAMAALDQYPDGVPSVGALVRDHGLGYGRAERWQKWMKGEVPRGPSMYSSTARDTADVAVSIPKRGEVLERFNELQRIRAARADLQKALNQKWKELDTKATEVMGGMESMPDTSVLNTLLHEMWEDYNRTYIVPRWKSEIDKARKAGPEALAKVFDEEKGIIQWEYLSRGVLDNEAYGGVGRASQDWLPRSLKEEAEAAGIADPEKLSRYLNTLIETPITAHMPLSPLDLIAASSASGKRWTLWTHNRAIHAIRETTHTFYNYWLVDKVIRPATAFTVSGDELLRIWHKGGNRAAARYINDRLLFTQARVQTMLHGGNPLGRQAVRKGARYSKRVQDRLADLDYWTMKNRQWERMFYDGYGNGWVDILPGDPTYLDAAKRWTGGMMQQSGFRAFLRGEDAFREWWFSVDGASMRNGTVVRAGREGAHTLPMGDQWSEAYLGWKKLFEDVILKRAKDQGKFDEVLAAFQETGRMIDDAGGKARDIPDWVFDHMGAVRGVEKHTRRGLNPLRLTDAFFDRFFLDPVNYRRGFLAETVAKTERARLEGLYSTQGIKIVSDMEAARALGLKGLTGANRMGVSDFIAEMGLRNGIVPESFVDNLVQAAVDAEVEHMLYVADKGSRAGNMASKTLWPFAKPYADMMAFWGREMFRRPHWRGMMTDENLGVIRQAVTAQGQFNPRTPALISRLAATDFNIDQGWFGETQPGETKGLLPGSESTNLAPLMFLPTGGENPFYTLIPGWGFLPMWALDMVLANIGDPDNDPLGYQELIRNVQDVISGAGYGSPEILMSGIQRVAGGGSISQATEMAMDALTLFASKPASYSPINTMLGQPDREIDRARAASSVLADPEEWAAIAELESVDEINLYIDALAVQADKIAAEGNLYEQGSRFLVPASNKFSGELDELKNVWLDAGQMYDVLGDPNYDDTEATPRQRAQYVNDVRKKFFDLPGEQRDAMVAENPQLAVNLVSSWQWTDKAKSMGLDDGEEYRTDGSRIGLAKHDLYIRRNYIRPLAPSERIRRIVGYQLAAKERTAANLYESAARQVNDIIWNNLVDDDTKSMLEFMLTDYPEFSRDYGIDTPQELWDTWSRYESVVEEIAALDEGIEPVRGVSQKKEDRTPYDILRSIIKIPEEMKPWGTDWVGIDPKQLPSRFADITFDESMITDDMKMAAGALGIELTPGMTGLQLARSAAGVQVQTRGSLSLTVSPAYDQYIGSRSVVSRAADEALRATAFDDRYAPEWRAEVLKFIDYEQNMQNKWADAKLGMPPTEQLKIQERFEKLRLTADDNVVTDWDSLWNMRFERSYGPLGWTPPEPYSPFDDNGDLRSTAWKPVIQSLIDGDSLVVAGRPGAQRFHEIRLLGTRARDYGTDNDGATEDRDRLWDALQQARENGDTIYLVRQPDQYGNVDIYGRELAWLWIGDQPYYFPDELLPTRDPSGSSK